jgi:hypothetical protein
MEPAVLRKKSIRFSLTETRIAFVGDVLDGTSCIVPIFARRGGVKRLAWKEILGKSGSPISLPGGPAVVSGLNRCAREAERAQVYTCGALEIRKVTIN